MLELIQTLGSDPNWIHIAVSALWVVLFKHVALYHLHCLILNAISGFDP